MFGLTIVVPPGEFEVAKVATHRCHSTYSVYGNASFGGSGLVLLEYWRRHIITGGVLVIIRIPRTIVHHGNLYQGRTYSRIRKHKHLSSFMLTHTDIHRQTHTAHIFTRTRTYSRLRKHMYLCSDKKRNFKFSYTS